MIKGYLFDFGGTLDTAGCHWGQMLWHAYQRQQVPVTEEQFREAYVHGERTLGRTPIIQSDYTFHKTLEDVYQKVVEITAHSAEVLAKLAENYPMVLVSNFYGNISQVLEEFHLDGFFKSIVESAVVGIRKPDHRIYLLGVEALGLKPEECMVVGDSFYKDIEPAKKAGCHAAWFKGEGWTEQEYDETIPDLVITDLAQLLA